MKGIFHWYFSLFDNTSLAFQGLVIFLTVFCFAIIYSQAKKFFTRGKHKIQEIRVASDEELARKQYGILEKGLSVYVFDRKSHEIVSIYNDRFRCSRELDPELFRQIKSINKIHAERKYRKLEEL